MEIRLARGGTEVLNMAVEGWLVVGKVSYQRQYIVCNLHGVHTSHWRDVGN